MQEKLINLNKQKYNLVFFLNLCVQLPSQIKIKQNHNIFFLTFVGLLLSYLNENPFLFSLDHCQDSHMFWNQTWSYQENAVHPTFLRMGGGGPVHISLATSSCHIST